jgi:hypothetical protein
VTDGPGVPLLESERFGFLEPCADAIEVTRHAGAMIDAPSVLERSADRP